MLSGKSIQSFLIGCCIVVSLYGQDQAFSQAPEEECVVLLHGLGRTSRSMTRLAAGLRDADYNVVNWDYPSRRQPIEQLAAEQLPQAVKACRQYNVSRIHFVTHSMGGILVRSYLRHHDLPDLGRVVMLSPPNGGSEIVDTFGSTFFFRIIYGPAGSQLGTSADSFVNRLPPVAFPVGVITGDRSVNPLFSLLIPGGDDGEVSLDSARVEGMQDFLVVHASHPLIMRKLEAISQTVQFLRRGAFNHSR
jgi:pimeloyl-ACP methyl ester carboxylesterase